MGRYGETWGDMGRRVPLPLPLCRATSGCSPRSTRGRSCVGRWRAQGVSAAPGVVILLVVSVLTLLGCYFAGARPREGRQRHTAATYGSDTREGYGRGAAACLTPRPPLRCRRHAARQAGVRLVQPLRPLLRARLLPPRTPLLLLPPTARLSLLCSRDPPLPVLLPAPDRRVERRGHAPPPPPNCLSPLPPSPGNVPP